MTEPANDASEKSAYAAPTGVIHPSTVLGYATFAVVATLVLASCYWLRLEPFAAPTRIHRAIPLAILLIVSGAFCVYFARIMPIEKIAQTALRIERARSWFIAALALVVLISTAIIALVVLRGSPISGDEGAYLFQSNVFRSGHLWIEPFPIQKYVDAFYISEIKGKLVSQYPPGWAALLAFADLLGLPPWLVNPILGAVTILALFTLAARCCGQAVALLAAMIFAASGFCLLNSASLFSHSLVALGGVLFVIAAGSFMKAPNAKAAVGMGASFAIVAVTRHYDAVLLALPVVVLLLVRGTWEQLLKLWIAAAAGVPLVAGLFLYYGAITGNLLQAPQTLIHPYDGLLGPNFSIWRATEITVGRAVELAEWVSPLFVVAYLWALLRIVAKGTWRFFDLYGVIFLCGYWLYWSDGGHRWGPRYLYPAFPFMALTLAAAAWEALKNPRMRIETASFVHLVAMSLVVALAQIPFLITGAGRIASEFGDVYDQVGRARIHKAVVLLASGTGITWKMPVGGLVRNGITLDRDVIYAHAGDILADQTDREHTRKALTDLHAFFTDRSLWIYQRDDGNIHGELAPALFQGSFPVDPKSTSR